MKHFTNTARHAAVVVLAAGLAVAGCANNPNNAPGAASNAPPPPAVSSSPPAQPQAATINWARSMCQALHPAFDQLGKPPQPDANNSTATRQAFVTYLENAGNATQQTIDRLSSIGAPPVDNGQQILDQVRNQLVELHTNLTDAAAQLKTADANDTGAIGRAFSAAGNVVGLLGTLTTNPQLRTAIDQTPECQNLATANRR